MNKLPKTKRMSTGDIAYQEIKKKIIKLEFEPNSILIEEELSAHLSVSRTPLRQALYRLELEGLIIKQSNGRMHVAPITVEEIEEVYHAREVLEGLMAREATINMDEEHLQKLEDLLVLMKFAAEQNRIEHTVSYGSEFHAVLYSLSSNKTVKRLMQQLNGQIERYRRLSGYMNPTYSPLVPVKEHEKIFELVKKGNPVEVENEVRQHISRNLVVAKETLSQYFQQND